MIRLVSCIFLVIVLAGFSAAATDGASPRVDNQPESVRVVAAASALATITGIAISPLLGMGVYGAYHYVQADEVARLSLPWFAAPGFFIPALIIAGICAAKDTLGITFPPGLKKPLDVLEVIENKLSGLIAAGAVIPITMSTLGKVLVGTGTASSASILPNGLATITLGAIDGPGSISLITVLGGLIVFSFVWMASHAINVLVLLSPWGAVDAALKLARTGLLALVAVTAQLDPRMAGVVCLGILVIAYLCSGWAFRLTVFGSVFCWDFFRRRGDDFTVSADGYQVFSSAVLTERKIPIRTYGRLEKGEGGRHFFRYRPWLFLPKRKVEVLDAKLTIGRGVFFSTVLAEGRSLFILPPRYLGQEEKVADVYGFAGVEDVGLRKIWSWFKDAAGLGSTAST